MDVKRVGSICIRNGKIVSVSEAYNITENLYKNLTPSCWNNAVCDDTLSSPRSVSPSSSVSDNVLDIKQTKTQLNNEKTNLTGARNKYFELLAQKNALELINQEEEEKFKALKKEVKKLRRKEKKKQDCTKNVTNNDNSLDNIDSEINNTSINLESAQPEELDINAAFVSKAIKKVKNPPEALKIQNREEQKSKKPIRDINVIIQTVIEFENKEQYKEAIQFLSEAIDLAPRRIDLLLKRSLMYYKVAKFEKSIRDAKKVLQLSSNNVEAYFRVGEANFALNNLAEADEAFTKLINLNSHTEIANKRLFSIHVRQLEEMGFNHNDAFTALLSSNNKTLEEAIEYLSNLKKPEGNEEDLYYSDEDESEEEEDEEEDNANNCEAPCLTMDSPAAVAAPTSVVVIDKRSPVLKDPSNPYGISSLFVGNLKIGITYNEVRDVFIKFGEIESIKLVTKPSCYAFVNYEESGSAGCAMEALQGSRWLLSTDPLNVKYPSKYVSQAKPTPAEKCPNTELVNEKRMRPPPKTEECYFWRTTGCIYNDKCFNLHTPELKGIDNRVLAPYLVRKSHKIK